jgi:amino-acid N-acetyltransferase
MCRISKPRSFAPAGALKILEDGIDVTVNPKRFSGMVRKARVEDVRAIQQLLAAYAGEGKLLARSLSELYTHLRDAFVFDDETGEEAVAGCCSLHIIWEDLAEIRSLAVRDSRRGAGIGRRLVEACIDEAMKLGIGTLFVLTYETGWLTRTFFPIRSGLTVFTAQNFRNATRSRWFSRSRKAIPPRASG